MGLRTLLNSGNFDQFARGKLLEAEELSGQLSGEQRAAQSALSSAIQDRLSRLSGGELDRARRDEESAFSQAQQRGLSNALAQARRQFGGTNVGSLGQGRALQGILGQSDRETQRGLLGLQNQLRQQELHE